MKHIIYRCRMVDLAAFRYFSDVVSICHSGFWLTWQFTNHTVLFWDSIFYLNTTNNTAIADRSHWASYSSPSHSIRHRNNCSQFIHNSHKMSDHCNWLCIALTTLTCLSSDRSDESWTPRTQMSSDWATWAAPSVKAKFVNTWKRSLGW